MSIGSMAASSTGDIQMQTIEPAGGGSQKKTWSTIYSGIAMRVGPASAGEQSRRKGLPVLATDKVYVASGLADLDNKEDYRILVDGRTLEILGVRNVDEVSRFYQISCREVRKWDSGLDGSQANSKSG